MKAVCTSIVEIYSLLNALKFKVLFLFKLCMYIYVYQKSLYVLYVGWGQEGRS